MITVFPSTCLGSEGEGDIARNQRGFGSEILRGILTRDPGKYYNVLNALARFAATQPSASAETSRDDKT